jgi:hypothetical protein
MKLSRIAAVVAFLGMLGVILYFTFRDSSRLAEVPGMPQRWGLWLDDHDEFRHFIGFAALAGFAFALNFDQFFTRSHKRFIRRLRSTRYRTGRLGGLLVMVYLLELGQIGMPNRDFDWLDIVNGWAGIVFAWSIFYFWRSGHRRRRRLSHEKRHIPINVSSVRFR